MYPVYFHGEFKQIMVPVLKIFSPYLHSAVTEELTENQNLLCKYHITETFQYFWLKYHLGQKYWANQVRPDRGSNSWPLDHDSTLRHWDACSNHLTISDLKNVLPHYLWGLRWFQMHRLSDRLMHWQLIFLVKVSLRTEVLSTPSSTRPGFEHMTSRSWQHTSCHWDARSNHLAISDFVKSKSSLASASMYF